MTFFCTIFLQHTLVAVYTLQHKKREFAFIYVLFIAFRIYGVYNCFSVFCSLFYLSNLYDPYNDR